VDLDDVNRHLVAKNAKFRIAHLKSVSEVPRRPNGKIDRPAVRDLAQQV
jgi:acyl-coenzyme A synthetase/AMP-(fatty) acid ligase